MRSLIYMGYAHEPQVVAPYIPKIIMFISVLAVLALGPLAVLL